MSVTLHVCLTCRDPLAPPDQEGTRAGALLHARLAEAFAGEALAGEAAIRVVGVECLSNCKRGCSVALSGPGRWTYVYGDLHPDASAPAIVEGALKYAATADGLTPWRERPEIFRKGVIARVPPIPNSGDQT